MNSEEIRSRFLKFFENRGHKIIPSASLVTSDEKGITNQTLFNSAGMQPLIPYLLGEPHPKGKRLVDVQKCLRTVDIDDIGDKTHATFFEMLGNWSLGDYFKKEAIEWSFEFLTSEKEGLGLDPNRLYVTVFKGDENAPRDDEAADIWRELFRKNNVKGWGGNTTNGQAGKIFYLPAENNWWEAGDSGPCGPDSEMFYDIPNRFKGEPITHEQYLKADEVRDVVEVWNDVFMQYVKKDGKIIGKLPKPSVDTGAGLERLAMTMQNVDNIYDTDLFQPILKIVREFVNSTTTERIMADHMRSASFLISDGVTPSNTDRGYVLRRLIRRAVAGVITHSEKRSFDISAIDKIVQAIASIYGKNYAGIREKSTNITSTITQEIEKFLKALADGLPNLEKAAQNKHISGAEAFKLFASFGLPIDLIIDISKEKGVTVDTKGFEEEFRKHQELSRSGAEQKFKGGLADSSDPQVVRYHTATHLLHQALNDVLGDGVGQKGSNITPERLRFDFSFTAKMTDEQKRKVEEIVNDKIKETLPVKKVIMPLAEAEKTGARHFFGEKYGEEVSIYYIGENLETAYSKEFCGGPHVNNTSELGNFKILKEEAVSAGVRRIKAVLE